MSLPSLKSLQVFEAAARLGSFAEAAEAVHLTAAAVSYQIAQLEQRIGLMLFRRTSRGIVLTNKGQVFLTHVRAGLRQIQLGVEAIDSRDADILTISMSPSVAQLWFLPRMASFLHQHPTLDIRINATNRIVDLADSGVDLALRYGNGNWPAVVAIKLGHEWIQPLCSPRFKHNLKAEITSQSLAQLPLLHDDSLHWEDYFAHLGTAVECPLTKGPLFDDANVLLAAAEAGQGVALGRSLLAAELIASGRLVDLVGKPMQSPFSYYFVCESGREEEPKISAARAWLGAAFADCDHA